jgi:seryl-tRNA synthetase
MLDLNFLKENRDLVEKNLKERGVKVDLTKFFSLLDERNQLIQEIDNLKAKRNEISKKFPQANDSEKSVLSEEVNQVKDALKEMEPRLEEAQAEFKRIWLEIPNMSSEDTPIGGTDADNVEIYRSVQEVKFAFQPKDHTELLNDNYLDFERGVKVSGAKFYFLKNEIALLEQALIQFTIDKVVNKFGFQFFSTPDLALNDVILGTGFNPRGVEKQIYNIEGEETSLIGTAEIVLGGYHRDETLNIEELPLKYLGLSHCFRTEAGAYGRTSKGLYRVHQFSKLEMFLFSSPEKSAEMLELLREIETEIFTDLEIPFRVIKICSGDMGGPAYKKYDLEAWMVMKGDEKHPSGDWGEVTSCSNCTDYQARRLNIKYADGSKKEFVHTLNGTAISLARAIIAFVENHQDADGNIKIPKLLQPYLFNRDKIVLHQK